MIRRYSYTKVFQTNRIAKHIGHRDRCSYMVTCTPKVLVLFETIFVWWELVSKIQGTQQIQTMKIVEKLSKLIKSYKLLAPYGL